MYSLVLLNGGVGARVAAGQPKQFVKVNGIPILVYSLVAADATAEIDQIVLNYPAGWKESVEELVADYAIKTPVVYVQAGSSRHESVAAGVEACTNDHVIIHEAARPLVTATDFSTLIASDGVNVSLMLEIPFTVAPVDPETKRVTGSLDRDRLRNVQLPQKFSRADLTAAHVYAKREGVVFTEDATLLAVAGFDVSFITGSDRNLKVTTPTDVRLASFLLQGEELGDE